MSDNYWNMAAARDIPSSLELFPVIFDYIGPETRILDAGCGGGRVCAGLYMAGFLDLYGVDINRGGIERARNELSGLGMRDAGDRFIKSDAAELPFGDGFFGCVVNQAFWTVVTRRREAVMSEIARVLKKGGVLYVADFDRNDDIPLYAGRYAEGAAKGYEPGEFDVTDESGGVLFRARHYERDELSSLISYAGLDIRHYSSEIMRTRSGNRVRGHVFAAVKK